MRPNSISTTCLLSCLPVTRPICSRRIQPVFCHNTEYWHTNTDLLFQSRFIHCAKWLLSSFIDFLSLWLVNEKVRHHWIDDDELYWKAINNNNINCTAYTNYVTLMAKYMCNWLCHMLKLLPSTYLLCTDLSQPG